jgi:hypothetical protein
MIHLLDKIRGFNTTPKSISAPPYQILRDSEQNEQLIRNGFIVLPVLSDEQVAIFRALYEKWHPSPPESFYKSFFNSNETYRKEVDELIMTHFRPALDRFFVDYHAFGGMFVVKPKGPKGHIPPHQDFSFVDERIHWSLNSWVPIVDAMAENGNIQMLPGSHFFYRTERGMNHPDLYEGLHSSLMPYLVDVPLKAGQGVFFYHGIVHCSTYNHREEARVTLGLSMVQKEAPILFHYLRPGQKRADRFLVEDTNFYFDYTPDPSQPPASLPHLGKSDFNFRQLNKKELLAKINAVNHP